MAWRPVVIDVLEGYTNFPRESFDKHIETFYPLSVGLLEKDVGADLRQALWGMFRRVGEVKFNMQEWVPPRGRDGSVSSVADRRRNGSMNESATATATPTSPSLSGSRAGFERRGSRVSRIGSI